ncbi:hypothetical protein NPIL_269431 [Nephila pilipes]|uniref:Uncharacterized protein n=1 Tax=Nephila pilipes TaxID=299642 RepID=A0A8X6UFR0_NEPPI|nr:hypothetical protein NPIL_269431 [Nephila pilipes]
MFRNNLSGNGLKESERFRESGDPFYFLDLVSLSFEEQGVLFIRFDQVETFRVGSRKMRVGLDMDEWVQWRWRPPVHVVNLVKADFVENDGEES